MKNLLRNRLMQLYRDNPLPEGDRIARVKNEGEVATIYVYAPIGSWFGIDAEQFARDLQAITASTIHLHVNSPGGDVFDGRAMAAAIRNHPANVTCHIDGLCASAATYLATASNRVVMEAGSFYMIHNAWTLTIGDKRDAMAAHDLLAQIDETIVDEYAKATGKSKEEIARWMDDETWFNPKAAVEAGFADELAGEDAEDDEDTSNASKRAGVWNLSAYRNAPKLARPEPRAHNLALMARRLELRERLAR